MAVNNIPTAINYTNRDFYSLRGDLISRVQARVNTPGGAYWSGTDASDFGVAIVEAFAHVGDISNYYIDRVANEGFLATAIQRQSLLDIAQLYGYAPAGYRQATVTISFTNYSTTDSVVLPIGTEVLTTVYAGTYQTTLYFTLTDTIVVPIAASSTVAGTVTGTATHGRNVTNFPSNGASSTDATDIAGELLGHSTGLSNQRIALKNTPVVESSVEVYVYDGSGFVLWTKVDNLGDYGPNDIVYTTETDSNDIVYVVFGDGISGAIPTLGNTIKTAYVTGGGLVGNIPGGQTFTLSAIPTNNGVQTTGFPSVDMASSAAAYGGDDPESNDSIRKNIPASLKTLSRAVSLEDYRSLALSVAGVGKASAKATQPNSVVLYVGPTVSDVSSDYYPKISADTAASITSYFSDKTQIGVAMTVLPPTYIDAKVAVQYNKLPTYTHDQMIAAIKYGVVYGLGYNTLDFDATIYPEQIEASLMQIPGIVSLKAVYLYRATNSAARTVLIPASGEFFVFSDANMDVYPTASLSTMAASSGTFSPAFSSATFNYALTGVTTSTITLTPTAWDATCVIKVNGTTVASGVASGSISTPTGTTTITVTVTSADGLSSNTYTITVTR